jgi:hypothetical protein
LILWFVLGIGGREVVVVLSRVVVDAGIVDDTAAVMVSMGNIEV